MIDLMTEEPMVDLIISIPKSRYEKWERISNILGISVHEWILTILI